VLWRLDSAPTERPDLAYELLLARGRLHLAADQLDAAVADAHAAATLGRRAFGADRERWSSALVLVAQTSARAGRCEQTHAALDELRATLRYDADPVEQLGWVVDIIHAFERPGPPGCARAQQQAWTLATRLSINGGGQP
jgi:hypothetical protein